MAVQEGAMQRAFDRKGQSWVQYNASAGGRLRHAIILHHLQTYLPRAAAHILDVGGGTGETLELAASSRLPYRQLARLVQFVARKE